MRLKHLFLALFLSFSAASNAYAVETTGVVVTIKPLHSLVSNVIGDTGKAELLLTGDTSPHDFYLKPSQVKAMHNANVIFYIDDSFETFLSQTFESLPDHVRKVAMAQKAGLTVLSQREGGGWEAHKHEAHEHGHHDHHDHDHGHHHDEHGSDDMHVWLDPENARRMVKSIAKELSVLYPENADIYNANANETIKKIDSVDAELNALLASVKNEPFIVFHDAYQYFERAYGLSAVGSITFEPDESPSPRRIQEVRAKLEETGARCVFSEPQFSDRLVNTVTEGMDAKRGMLDPLGVNLEDGPELYIKLLQHLAQNVRDCLS